MAEGRARATCDSHPDHRPPIYTLTVLAMEVGPGTRQKDAGRRCLRLPLQRLCADCLAGTVFRVSGLDVLAAKVRGPEDD